MQRGTVQSTVIEGIGSDTCLIVIEERDRSYVIVKGEHDNIVVELDDDGWANLAMVAAAQQSKMSLANVVNGQGGRTMVSAAIRDEMDQSNMLVSEIAQEMGIDRAAMQEVVDSIALLPEWMNDRLSYVFGFSPWSVTEMQRTDRVTRSDLEDVSPTYVSRTWRRKRK